MAIAYAQAGRFNEAQAAIENIAYAHDKSSALRELATAKMQAGTQGEMQKLINNPAEHPLPESTLAQIIPRGDKHAYNVGFALTEHAEKFMKTKEWNKLPKRTQDMVRIGIAVKKHDTERIKTLAQFVNQDYENIRAYARALRYSHDNSADALWEMWNKLQSAQQDLTSKESARILSALAQEDIARGGAVTAKVLANPKLAPRRFAYLARVLIHEGYFPESLERLLVYRNKKEFKKRIAFVQQLLAKYPEQASTVFETLEKLDLDPVNEDVARDVFSGLNDLGAIPPAIFARYREIQDTEERKAFALRMKKLQSSFFLNKNISALVSEDEQHILNEMIYMAYKPVNMSYSNFLSLLEKIEDRTEDIAPYLPDDYAGEEILLKKVQHVLREGKHTDHNLMNKLNIVLQQLSKDSIKNETDNMKAFSLALKKVARGGHDISDAQLGLLLSPLGKPDVDLKNNTYHGLSALAEHFGIYAQDHLTEALKKLIQSDETTEQAFKAILVNGKKYKVRRNNLINTHKIETKNIKSSEQDEDYAYELIACAILNIAQKRLLQPINRELKKYESVEVNEGANRNLKAYLSKNVGSFFAKAAAGICTAADTWLWNQKNHFHLNMVENDERVRMNVQCYIIDDPKNPDKKSLVLRGFNPTQEFLKSGVSPHSLVQAVFDVARRFAKRNNMQNIYITPQGTWHALTNRNAEIFPVLKKYLRYENKVKHKMRVASSHTVHELYIVHFE